MMFHYGWIASVVLIIYLTLEYVVGSGNDQFEDGLRITTYTGTQWKQLIAISIINAIGMNCNTIAAQYEKSAFISLVGYIQVFFAFIADVAVFH